MRRIYVTHDIFCVCWQQKEMHHGGAAAATAVALLSAGVCGGHRRRARPPLSAAATTALGVRSRRLHDAHVRPVPQQSPAVRLLFGSFVLIDMLISCHSGDRLYSTIMFSLK